MYSYNRNKVINAYLDDAVALSTMVNEMGGRIAPGELAKKMGRKNVGTFVFLLSTAAKLGFINRRYNLIVCTREFKEKFLAGTDQEKKQFLKDAFLNIRLFNLMFRRYGYFPTKDNVLEFLKKEKVATTWLNRVTNYYLDGIKIIR